MAVTKTYELLSTLPKTKIEKCSAMLENHLQCWKAGDLLITITTPAPTKDDPKAVSITSYQKCRRHAQAEKDADERAESQKLDTKVEKQVGQKEVGPASIPAPSVIAK